MQSEATVEVWYNPSIEKYQFKVFIESENAIVGVTNASIEDGIEKLQSLFPGIDFYPDVIVKPKEA